MKQAMICTRKSLLYKGVLFEVAPIGSPYWPLKRNGDPYERVPRHIAELMDELRESGAELGVYA